MDEPLDRFRAWYAEAARAVATPEAIAVATAAPDGRPSVRMVLLKGFDERGFVFFTNYDSRKGRELAANPHAALVAHWAPLGRQVRIEGRVERVDPAESDEYWRTRPVLSRRAAAASRQSEPVESREALEEAFAAAPADPERPEWWGGFRVVAEVYEFWQHGENRLHDRLRYVRDGDAWRVERLQP